jgi:hypothetical protein
MFFLGGRDFDKFLRIPSTPSASDRQSQIDFQCPLPGPEWGARLPEHISLSADLACPRIAGPPRARSVPVLRWQTGVGGEARQLAE